MKSLSAKHLFLLSFLFALVAGGTSYALCALTRGNAVVTFASFSVFTIGFALLVSLWARERRKSGEVAFPKAVVLTPNERETYVVWSVAVVAVSFVFALLGYRVTHDRVIELLFAWIVGVPAALICARFMLARLTAPTPAELPQLRFLVLVGTFNAIALGFSLYSQMFWRVDPGIVQLHELSVAFLMVVLPVIVAAAYVHGTRYFRFRSMV